MNSTINYIIYRICKEAGKWIEEKFREAKKE